MSCFCFRSLTGKRRISMAGVGSSNLLGNVKFWGPLKTLLCVYLEVLMHGPVERIWKHAVSRSEEDRALWTPLDCLSYNGH